jgi:hypothetical protein
MPCRRVEEGGQSCVRQLGKSSIRAGRVWCDGNQRHCHWAEKLKETLWPSGKHHSQAQVQGGRNGHWGAKSSQMKCKTHLTLIFRSLHVSLEYWIELNWDTISSIDRTERGCQGWHHIVVAPVQH